VYALIKYAHTRSVIISELINEESIEAAFRILRAPRVTAPHTSSPRYAHARLYLYMHIYVTSEASIKLEASARACENIGDSVATRFEDNCDVPPWKSSEFYGHRKIRETCFVSSWRSRHSPCLSTRNPKGKSTRTRIAFLMRAFRAR